MQIILVGLNFIFPWTGEHLKLDTARDALGRDFFAGPPPLVDIVRLGQWANIARLYKLCAVRGKKNH